jgi:hypothetical protein
MKKYQQSRHTFHWKDCSDRACLILGNFDENEGLVC